MDKLEQKLNHYLDSKQPDLAFEIDGEWGMGKTYTLKKFFEEKKENFVYVSVNGIQDFQIDDLFYEAAITALPMNVKGIKTKSLNMVRYLKKFGLSIKGLSVDVPISFIAKQAQEQLKNESLVYLVDDLERIADKKAMAKLFGFIASVLQETYEAHVIILVNEAEIKDNELEYFTKNREKIINNIVRFDINKDLVLKNLTEKLNNYPISQTENLSGLVANELIISNDNLNLRSIKVLVEHLNEIKEKVIQLDFEEMKNQNISQKFWKNLINSLYQIVTVFRMGNVDPLEISKIARVSPLFQDATEQLIKYVISDDDLSIKNLITQYLKNYQLVENNPSIETLRYFRDKSVVELKEAQKELTNKSDIEFERVQDAISLLSVISFLHENGLWIIDEQDYLNLLNNIYTCLNNFKYDDFDDYLSIPEGFRPKLYGNQVEEKIEKIITRIKEDNSGSFLVIEEIKNGDYRNSGWYILKDQGKSNAVFSSLMRMLVDENKNSTEVRNVLRYMTENFGNFDQNQKMEYKTMLETIMKNTSGNYDKILLFNISEQLDKIAEFNKKIVS